MSKTCETCQWWGTVDVRRHGGYDSALPLDWNDEVNYENEADNVRHEFQVRMCNSPYLLSLVRPGRDQAALIDPDDAGADLVTGPGFSCLSYRGAV